MGVLLLTSVMALPLCAAEKNAGKPIKRDPMRWEETIKAIGIPVTTVYASGQNRSAKTGGVVGFLLRHVDLPASGDKGMVELLLAICFLREAPERTIGGVSVALHLPKPERRAGKWGSTYWKSGRRNPSQGTNPANWPQNQPLLNGCASQVSKLRFSSHSNPRSLTSSSSQPR
jgi:hypothetical protein